ncbi:acid-sensing ion channel 3 [Elysia marginata]|uniref:Acid-sensing ion channel 3 n=1 Tax=Elysia marginata TaxID=1093978 RepID=A0AAV4HFT5_9GAST|nr:acid-sensing ion channel 3 [Elysia marginata]
MYDIYSAVNCEAECKFNYLVKACGCRGYHDPGDASVCSGKEYLKCYIRARRSFNQSDLLTCKCPKECDSTDFIADLDYADFASRISTVDVKIFFKTLDIQVIEQKPAVSVQDVLGSLGGQMGLFLGASIVSMVEILEMLLILISRCVHRCRHSEETGPKIKSPLRAIVPAWQAWTTSSTSRTP